MALWLSGSAEAREPHTVSLRAPGHTDEMEVAGRQGRGRVSNRRGRQRLAGRIIRGRYESVAPDPPHDG